MTGVVYHPPPPPDWLVRWCLLYLRHVAPWVLYGLIATTMAIWVVLRIQRQPDESEPAKALRSFILSKAPLWVLFAFLPTPNPPPPPPPGWWLVAETAIVTWIAVTSCRFLLACLRTYVWPAWACRGGRCAVPARPLDGTVLPNRRAR